jgi:hypothetical protein
MCESRLVSSFDKDTFQLWKEMPFSRSTLFAYLTGFFYRASIFFVFPAFTLILQ